MKHLCFVFGILGLIACAQTDKISTNNKLPAKAVSADSVARGIKGKYYEVKQAGLASVFDKDSSITWNDNGKDTSAMYKAFMANAKAFRLQFKNDTALQLTTGGQSYNGTYSVQQDSSTYTVLLLLKYADPEMAVAEPEQVTFTYVVKGFDGEGLLLQTPRSYNRQPLVVWMGKKSN